MAGYECALCQGEEQATLLITPLTGGETMAVGESCMAVAFTGMLAGHLGVGADKLWAAAERLVKREQAKAAKAPEVAKHMCSDRTHEAPADAVCFDSYECEHARFCLKYTADRNIRQGTEAEEVK